MKGSGVVTLVSTLTRRCEAHGVTFIPGLLDWDSTRIVFTKRSLIEFLKYVQGSLVVIISSDFMVQIHRNDRGYELHDHIQAPQYVHVRLMNKERSSFKTGYAPFGKVSESAPSADAAEEPAVAPAAGDAPAPAPAAGKRRNATCVVPRGSYFLL